MGSIQIKIKKNIFNDIYYPYLTDYSKRHEVYYGAAGSGKSVFITQKILLKLLNDPNRLCLVVKKTQASLRDSCFALFKSTLYDWGLADQCNINKTDMAIELPNGSKIIFKGIDDSEKIKSIANISDIFCEEATDLNEEDFDQLNLRLRNAKKKNNQIYIAFNPISKVNWVYKRWFAEDAKYDKDKTMILQTTYKDNKFLPQDYIDSLLSLKETNYARYLIYAEGEFASLDEKVFNNWETKAFDYKQILEEDKDRDCIYGLDFGFVHDPTAIVCSIIDNKTKEIWIYDCYGKKGMTNDEIFKQLQEMEIHTARVVCDCAEQKSIEDLKRMGAKRVVACSKGRDSIINGINLIQEYHIYVHPNCYDVEEEFLNYTWIKDKKTGEYINKPIDKFNHFMDAFRYSVTDKVNTKSCKLKLLDRRLLF